MSHINYVSNAWDGCACVHMKQLYPLHKRAIKFLMPSSNMDYNQRCCALKLLPLDKKLLLNKCVLKQKVVHVKAPQYLKDLMIPSERLHVHGNKQLLPKTRIDIFKTSFSFSGSLPHHLRYPMELKTFKRKAFQALTKPHWYLFFHSPDNLDTKCTVSLLTPSPCVFLSGFAFIFKKKINFQSLYFHALLYTLSLSLWSPF